jgi:hypothetical protein
VRFVRFAMRLRVNASTMLKHSMNGSLLHSRSSKGVLYVGSQDFYLSRLIGLIGKCCMFSRMGGFGCHKLFEAKSLSKKL